MRGSSLWRGAYPRVGGSSRLDPGASASGKADVEQGNNCARATRPRSRSVSVPAPDSGNRSCCAPLLPPPRLQMSARHPVPPQRPHWLQNDRSTRHAVAFRLRPRPSCTARGIRRVAHGAPSRELNPLIREAFHRIREDRAVRANLPKTRPGRALAIRDQHRLGGPHSRSGQRTTPRGLFPPEHLRLG